LAPVGRSEIPEEEKLDTGAIADAIQARGGDARACTSVDQVVEAAAAEAKPGDTIVVMSNGRFEDAPDRILVALIKH
jgi:UDP-N-acetylmuramate: L-alanyl-gamma-D-glutamyl-meso-diaminopimelate ligase